jgi:hypothetical protein
MIAIPRWLGDFLFGWACYKAGRIGTAKEELKEEYNER